MRYGEVGPSTRLVLNKDIIYDVPLDEDILYEANPHILDVGEDYIVTSKYVGLYHQHRHIVEVDHTEAGKYEYIVKKIVDGIVVNENSSICEEPWSMIDRNKLAEATLHGYEGKCKITTYNGYHTYEDSEGRGYCFNRAHLADDVETLDQLYDLIYVSRYCMNLSTLKDIKNNNFKQFDHMFDYQLDYTRLKGSLETIRNNPNGQVTQQSERIREAIHIHAGQYIWNYRNIIEVYLKAIKEKLDDNISIVNDWNKIEETVSILEKDHDNTDELMEFVNKNSMMSRKKRRMLNRLIFVHSEQGSAAVFEHNDERAKRMIEWIKNRGKRVEVYRTKGMIWRYMSFETLLRTQHQYIERSMCNLYHYKSKSILHKARLQASNTMKLNKDTIIYTAPKTWNDAFYRPIRYLQVEGLEYSVNGQVFDGQFEEPSVSNQVLGKYIHTNDICVHNNAAYVYVSQNQGVFPNDGKFSLDIDIVKLHIDKKTGESKHEVVWGYRLEGLDSSVNEVYMRNGIQISVSDRYIVFSRSIDRHIISRGANRIGVYVKDRKREQVYDRYLFDEQSVHRDMPNKKVRFIQSIKSMEDGIQMVVDTIDIVKKSYKYETFVVCVKVDRTQNAMLVSSYKRLMRSNESYFRWMVSPCNGLVLLHIMNRQYYQILHYRSNRWISSRKKEFLHKIDTPFTDNKKKSRMHEYSQFGSSDILGKQYSVCTTSKGIRIAYRLPGFRCPIHVIDYHIKY